MYIYITIKTNKNMKTLTNTLHSQIFSNTWMYNNNILKRYAVNFTVENLKSGIQVNTKLTIYVNAYNENEASQLASVKYNNPAVKIVSATSTPLNQI
jgi:hypothetical protein